MAAALRPVVIAAALAVCGWYGWGYLFPDDEAEIRAVLERIAEGVSSGGEGGVSRIARAAALRHEFSPQVTVDAGAPFERLTGRDAVIGMAAKVAGAAKNLDVRFDDVSIVLGSEGDTADVSLTAYAQLTDAAGGHGVDARELKAAFSKTDGRWLVRAVTLVRAIQPMDTR